MKAKLPAHLVDIHQIHWDAVQELGLAETQQVLVMNDLRGRVRVQTDGQVKTARDCVVAFLLGADEIGFSTAPLITLGCIMMRVCHLNTCPVGVATQDAELRKKFIGKPEYVVNFFTLLAEEIRELMAKLGYRTVEEMVRAVERLDMEPAVDHWKAKGIDLSSLLYKPETDDCTAIHHVTKQDHGLETALDYKMIELAKSALQNKKPVKMDLTVRNVNRTIGAILSSEVSRAFEADGLPADTIHCKLNGVGRPKASARSWRPGITLELEGDAKAASCSSKGPSGGRVIVYPPKISSFKAEENMIVGNVVLYGAVKAATFFPRNGRRTFRGLATARALL